MTAPEPWPKSLHYRRAERALAITFEDGSHFVLPAEYLRVESPSAEVQGHGGDTKQIVPGKAGVTITAIEPVGRYAVRLVFDDGHDSGLYTWRYLHELGRERDARWQRYLNALAAKGLPR
ncbi:MAG: DUF971 domain-containing protein [Alphaproteobacteria bacterium]|nr:MAG: DUF971 domain-containing protein [Alphaproteobacteria bacterium]